MYGDGEKRPMLAHFGGGISIESLPASIAAGESNEMRVAAALWDLYDVVNESGDEIGVRFEDIWEVLAQSNGKPINGLRQFVAGLIRINFTDEAIIAKIHRTLAANGIVYDLDDMKQYVTAK